MGTHGIIINFLDPLAGVNRSATFLPEVPFHEEWDHDTTMEQLVRKAGCTAASTSVRRGIKLTRYQSTTCTLSYEQYLKIKDPALYSQPTPDVVPEDAIPVPA